MDKDEWEDTVGTVFYGIIMFLCLPTFVLSVVVTAWMTGLSTSNRHAIQDALGSKNLIVSGACGISGSVTWTLGTFIILANNLPGLLVLLLSVVLWVIVLAMTPWNAGSILSRFFQSIHSSQAASRTITALLALVCTNVISFVLMMLTLLVPLVVPHKTASTGSRVVAAASVSVAAASIVQPSSSSSRPTDLERTLPISDGTLLAPAQQGLTPPNYTDKQEIQDGAG